MSTSTPSEVVGHPPPLATPIDPEYPTATKSRCRTTRFQFSGSSPIKEGAAGTPSTGNPDVFVAAIFLWYPVLGRPKIPHGPRHPGRLGQLQGVSRLVRDESGGGGIAPQVVFEVLSPGNRHGAWRQFAFYEPFRRRGVLRLRPRPWPALRAGYARAEGLEAIPEIEAMSVRGFSCVRTWRGAR